MQSQFRSRVEPCASTFGGAPQPSAVPTSLADGTYLPAEASTITRLRVAYRALRALEKAQDDPVAAALMNASLDGDVYRRHAAWLAETEAGRSLVASSSVVVTGSSAGIVPASSTASAAELPNAEDDAEPAAFDRRPCDDAAPTSVPESRLTMPSRSAVAVG